MCCGGVCVVFLLVKYGWGLRKRPSKRAKLGLSSLRHITPTDDDEPDAFVDEVDLFVSFELSGINPIIYNKCRLKFSTLIVYNVFSLCK